MGVGEAKTDAKVLDAAIEELTIIAGQRAQLRRARKSIAQFKLREGMPIGARMTLRGDRMWEFFDRLVSIALPRIRDFRGLNPESFDGRGNYSLGLREQIIFPEIDYDSIEPDPRPRRRDHDHRPDRRAGRGAAARPRACRLRPKLEGTEERLGQEVADREGRAARRSTRRATTAAATSAAALAPCSRSSGSAASACGSSPTRASSPA